jgi:RNA polymerase sigma factor (TIGR02999 family)
MDSPISELIEATERGNEAAKEALFAALYDELHRIARRELGKNGAFLSLGVTTLLHEAYLDIANRHGPEFPDRPRFLAYAARVMRGVVIDHVRNRKALKRGGQYELTLIDPEVIGASVDYRELTRINDALEELERVQPDLAGIVDLKFFCGFSFPEIAAMRSVTERTVQRQWEKARLFLYHSIRADLSD